MFTRWLEEHIDPHMLRKGEKWNRRTFMLRENTKDGRMTLRVDDVPGTATVMRFDEGKRRELFDTEQGNDFLKRCDFLILDESESEYRAIFVELKRSFEESEAEHPSRKRGEKQLRWSLPSLKYLLSVFEVDSCIESSGKEIHTRYFLVAKNPNQWYRKRRSKGHFVSDSYGGIVVHYTTRDKINFKVLVSRELIPTA